jgi:hypothetical protein
MNARIAEEEAMCDNDCDDDWNGGWDDDCDDYDEPIIQPDPHMVTIEQLTKLRDLLVARGFPFELNENDMVLSIRDLDKRRHNRTLRRFQTFIHKNTGTDGGYWAGFIDDDLTFEVMGYFCELWLQLHSGIHEGRKSLYRKSMGNSLASLVAFARRNKKPNLKSIPFTTPKWYITIDITEYY